MPQGAWTDKRERQYDHIKSNLRKRGRPEKTGPLEARHVRSWAQGRQGQSDPLGGIFRTVSALLSVVPIGIRGGHFA